MNELKPRGLFIVVEGLDGSGKTTLINNLKKLNNKANNKLKLEFCKETEQDGILEPIVEILKSSQEKLGNLERCLLFNTLRFHTMRKIEAWLEQGISVVLDRYVYSTLVYQGDKHNTLRLHNLLLDNKNLIPDVCFYLEAHSKTLMSRMSERGLQDDWEKSQFDEQLIIERQKKYMEYFKAETDVYRYTKQVVPVLSEVEPEVVAEYVLAQIKYMIGTTHYTERLQKEEREKYEEEKRRNPIY